MQKWKKYAALILAAVSLLAVCGCGEEPAVQSTEEQTETSVPIPTPEVTATPSPTATATAVPEAARTVQNSDSKYNGMTAEEITSALSLEQKAYQMVCPAIYAISAQDMRQYDYGAVLSSSSDMDNSEKGWKTRVLSLQTLALESEAAIPYLYGTDAVHGIGYCDIAYSFRITSALALRTTRKQPIKWGLPSETS